ncbi:Translation elongation factor P Lys34--(R)-beta-lysine ligase [uncultured Gammaproteobacteria bacterium]|jgi:lysyl-tRNA synthetase class 2|nr:Translation elongation factor P Lys34--(R)-beta-lysine ligase [uncultured Gammaproteobacteria bacterium]CAC9617745.1 Translation elongation factor P Lys34--(R)-beta-lysine ligase [uncultured Gammaproteobacteria bacterium]CAC9617847.1 Translation elongation factor P Lys34--(R)-beta-lysine ligase [uncultured Gammaproteobacteria bacterium]CAC9963402.1 Translation elongation factor P Lys34--(R)-beta-lysine ligase [uncultured Gammaproteobacteria bacterium]CAC9987569.1 Translation elongation facto
MRDALKKYACFLANIRQFFCEREVVEVCTLQLLEHPVTDVYIDSITAQVNKDIEQKSRYLHTSPELEMKKLLAQGSGDIYQICQVFRDNEQGSQNFNEFTMLEYYRLGFDIHQLMDDIVQLLKTLGVHYPVSKLSYAQAFIQYGNIDILNTDFKTLKIIAIKQGLTSDFEWIEDLQILLFTHLIEPQLQTLPLCFIYDYPASQSALAKVEGQVAHRFELYMNGVEIANGYDELQEDAGYKDVFSAELNKRQQLVKFVPEMNQAFLSQLENSLPQCSGVAIGMARLLSQIN